MAKTELKKLTLEDLYIDMEVSADQLSNIYDTYMIIKYSNNNNTVGKLV